MSPTAGTEDSATGTSQGSDFPSSDVTVKYLSHGMTIENNDSAACVGCKEEANFEKLPPVNSLLAEFNGGGVEAVTTLVWPVGREAINLEFRKKLAEGGVASISESQEDYGSGDSHVRLPKSQVTDSGYMGREWNLGEFMDRATASPSQTSTTGLKGLLVPATTKAISADSAEIDHLLQVSRETALQSPSPSGTETHDQTAQKPRAEISFETGKSNGPFSVLKGPSSHSTAQGVQGSTDIALVTEKPQASQAPNLPSSSALRPSEPPSDHSVSDLIDNDYYDLFDIDGHGGLGHFPGFPIPGGDTTKKIHDKKVPWPMPELYDDFTPFDESDFYPTASFYADGDDEGGIEDDDDDDDDIEEEDVEDGDVTARELEISNAPKTATLTPKVHTVMLDEKPTGKQHTPHQTFILYGGELHPKFHPEVNKDLTHTTSGSSDNSTECRNGYVRRNNSCKSVCEIYPTYCYNGGQCYIVENTGAFCRCNTQDYIWHKGMRCESIITDFQVMCVAVGTAALVVLLLFMMTVFFAKKLYLLKTENYKLRKRNRYRTPSELHNDNFSLSTIAEGSHPNVRKLCDTPSKLSPHARALAYYDNVICQEDPNAPQKVQDLPKVCLKDEEPFNIQNSLSPKHESGKGDPDIVDVNCVLNNLT
ncbi:chondroitin sulfate proteoglycan 5 isoform 1-T1 [Rhinophrynus dorsalis]